MTVRAARLLLALSVYFFNLTSPARAASPDATLPLAPAMPPVSPGEGLSASDPSADPSAAADPRPSKSLTPPEPTPGLGISVGPVDLEMHGYFRAPLRLGLRRRDGAKEGEGGTNVHTPWLVDDDYFRSGFAYTRLQESDWSELYFSVGNKHLRGEVALMGSLFSDWARPLIERQAGIAQANLTFRHARELGKLRFRMHIKGGAFWDRFGWLENYDTYMFGRTHQLGAQVRLELSSAELTGWLLTGIGAHLDSIEENQGLTLLSYLYTGVRWRNLLEGGFYLLDSRTSDKRQLRELTDANMSVYGLDARLTSGLLGRFYLAGSLITASKAVYLSPAIEVVHAYGGRGLTENYLGTEDSEKGTGSLRNLAGEYHHSLRTLLARVAPEAARFLGRGDLWFRAFAMMTHTYSKQQKTDPLLNRDGVLQYKWGTEVGYQPLSWMAVSLRYDRVIRDIQDNENSFRIITPRVMFTTNWLLGAQVFLQYSRYAYGERVQLRPGQVALETAPDENVFKIQAQMVF